MVPRAVLAVALLAAAAFGGQLTKKYSPKQLGGPPEEFAQHVIPSPADSGVASRAATFWVSLAPDANGMGTWTAKLPLDSNGFMFSVFSTELNALTITLKDPSGQYVPLDDKKVSIGYPVGDSNVYDMSSVYEFPDTYVLGIYELSISGPMAVVARRAAGTSFDAYVLLKSDSEDLLFTHLGGFQNLLLGQQVGEGGKKEKEEKRKRKKNVFFLPFWSFFLFSYLFFVCVCSLPPGVAAGQDVRLERAAKILWPESQGEPERHHPVG